MTCADCGMPCQGRRCRMCQRAARAEDQYQTMSDSDATTDWVDDREIDHDPFDVVPDGFCEAWNATNIPDALANAEEAPSSTPRGELRRCPNENCQSIKIRRKKANYELEHMKPENYRCEECGTHFDTPAAPSNEQATGEQTTLTEVVNQ